MLATQIYVSTGVQTDPVSEAPCDRDDPASHINVDVAPTTTTEASNKPPDGPSAEEWVAAVAKYIHTSPRADAPPTISRTKETAGGAAQHRDSDTVSAKPIAQAAETRSGFSEYANAAAEERRAALDSVIHELILDREFEVLCKDVEAAWKRIGLGW